PPGLRHRRCRSPGADAAAGAADRSAGLHGSGAGGAQPLEHRAVDRLAAPEAQAGPRGAVRPGHGKSLPPRHEVPALAARQGAAAMPLRPDRAPGKALAADRLADRRLIGRAPAPHFACAVGWPMVRIAWMALAIVGSLPVRPTG